MCVSMRKARAESVAQTRVKSSQSDGRRDAVQQTQSTSDELDLNGVQRTGM